MADTNYAYNEDSQQEGEENYQLQEVCSQFLCTWFHEILRNFSKFFRVLMIPMELVNPTVLQYSPQPLQGHYLGVKKWRYVNYSYNLKLHMPVFQN